MTLARKLHGASAVLVVREEGADGWDPFPTEFVGGSPEEANVVLVSGKPMMASWVGTWGRHHDEPFRRLCSVVIGGSFRGGAEQKRQERARVSLEAVSSPANLTDLGVLVDEYVGEWAEEPGDTLLVHSSLTRVLQYVELRELFKFVVVLSTCLQNANALGVFYLDADAHDEQTIGTLRVAFDAVVRRENGRTSVQYG